MSEDSKDRRRSAAVFVMEEDESWQMKTYTVTYKERNGRFVDRVIEAADRRDAFKIAQRHHVNPVKVIEGGTLPRQGDFATTVHSPGKVTIRERKSWWARLLFWK